MSQVIDRVREKYPEYAEVPDEELTRRIGSKYPQYFQEDPQFARDYDAATITPPIVPAEPEPDSRSIGQGVRATTGGPPAALASFAETIQEPVEVLTDPHVTTPKFTINPQDPVALAVGKEAVNIATSIPEFLSSDLGVVSGATALGAPALVAGAYTADMLHSLGKQILSAHKNWGKMTPAEKAVAVTDSVATGLMATFTGKATVKALRPAEVLAPQTTAALKGERNAIPVRSAAQVSVEEPPGNSPQVDKGTSAPGQVAVPQAPQTQAAVKAYQLQSEKKFTPKPPTPEEQAAEAAYLKAEREAIDAAEEKGMKTVVADETQLDDSVPWKRAFGQATAFRTPDGGLLINRRNLRTWLETNPGNESEMIQSLIGEEHLHGFVADEDATSYWQNLTRLEKRLVEKRYLEPDATQESTGLSDAAMGHEAIRGLMQQLSRMTPTEVVEKPTFMGRLSTRTIYFLENLVHRLRETLGTNASKIQRAILDRVQENIDAARERTGDGQASRLRKRPEQKEQLSLPPIEGKAERPTAEEMGAEQGLLPTPALIEAEAGRHLAESARPNFQSFVEETQTKFGGKVKASQLRDVWEDKLWPSLMESSGNDLARLRSSLGLEKNLGRRPIAEAAKPEKDFALESEHESGKRIGDTETREGKAQSQREQNYRNAVIARIGEKLLREAQEGKKAWQRPSIAPDELAHERQTSEGAWRPIAPGEANNPEALGRSLTEGGAVERTTSKRKVQGGKLVEVKQKAPPESVTRRVTALLNKTNGRVELVSTYRHSRKGAMLLDPQSPGGEHAQLGSILNRYRPIYSMLLDEPVQRFHQRFGSLKEFEEQFGDRARQDAAKSASYEPPIAEGEPTAEAPGAMFSGGPLTDAEAGALLDHLNDEVGKIEGPDDIFLAIEGLKGQKQAQVVAAYQKIYQAIKRKWPQLTDEQAVEQLTEEIYAHEKASANRETFVERTQKAYNESPAEPVPATAKESQTAKELTMRDRLPPTLTADEMAARRRNEGAASRLRIVRDEFEAIGEDIKNVTREWPTRDLVVRSVDSAESTTNNLSSQQEQRIRQASASKKFKRGNPEKLAAANALVQAGAIDANGNILNSAIRKLPIFRGQVAVGMARARAMAASGSFRQRRIGRAWMRNQEALGKELDYAEAHWNDPELQETARRMTESFREQRATEQSHGYDINEKDNYLPQRYDAALWSGHSILFNMAGFRKVLGKKFRERATFESYYAASEAGPYLAVTRDGASLVHHRVRQGTQMLMRDHWHDGLKAINTAGGQPLAIDPVRGIGERWLSPSQDYRIVPLGGGKPLVIHEDFAPLVKQLIDPSVIEQAAIPRAALHFSQQLKHSLLIGDFFHFARVLYYGTSIMGRHISLGKKGSTILDIAERDLNEAVAKGLIRQKDADWSRASVPYGTGTITRRALAEKFYGEMGANLGKVQDALYKDLVTKLSPTAGSFRRGVVRVLDPTVGRYNRFLFDRLTRGLMTEANLREFERQTKANPAADPEALMRDISRDVNNFFGNIGRQGWLKAAWQRDMARMFWLAPQWVEGLIKKEAVSYSRLSQFSALTGQRQGLTNLGTTGRAMGRGLALMFGLTQAINLITRGKPTWMNDEKEHKFDAWIPSWGGANEGFWMSPLTIYNEITHDLLRLGMTKPRLIDAFEQVAGNKEHPITRALLVLATGRSPTGEYPTTTTGVLKTAFKQLVPLPISFSKAIQAGGHALAPDLVAPAPQGSVQRQAMATAGIKVEPEQTPLQRISTLAQHYLEVNGLKHQGLHFDYTDEPSYGKLRAALRNDDNAGALSILNELRKTHDDNAIIKSMRSWAKRPFTGSKRHDDDFFQSLSDAEQEVFSRAEEQRYIELDRFLDWFDNVP